MNRRLRRAPDGDEPGQARDRGDGKPIKSLLRSPRPKAIAGAARSTAMPPRRCRARDRARPGT